MSKNKLFIAGISYNINFILLGVLTAAFATLVYVVLEPLLHWFTLIVLLLLATVIMSALLAKLLIRNEKAALDKLEYAVKNAYNGDYSARVQFDDNDPYQEWYRQFNDFLEQTEQKLAYIQVLGEAKVLQEAASVEAAVYEERKRLARDLHDSVSQQLFAIHMSASSLQKLQEINPERATEVMKQLVTMSSNAQQQMRKFIAHLRPMELENRSLSEALNYWYPDYCRQNNIQGRLDYLIQSTLSDAKEHQLFLIIQEAMANIVKHAQCTSCQLTLYETDKRVIVTLEDDGIGFKQEALTRKSYGLSTMQERAQKLSGDTEIISKEGRGTIVKVTIPKLIEKEPRI